MNRAAGYTETEARIFEAALHVFSVKGKEGARMQEIADRAAINKAMLHYYFRSKDRLYDEVFGYVFACFMDALGETLRATERFEDTLRTFIDGYVDFVGDNLEVVRLMVNENLAGGDAMGRHLKRIEETSSVAPPRLFVERMEQAVRQGEVRPVDPHHTLLTVISGCIFFFISFPTVRIMHPEAADRAAFIAARKAHLFDLLYCGLRAEPVASPA